MEQVDPQSVKEKSLEYEWQWQEATGTLGPLSAGAAFCTDTPSRKNLGFIQPSNFHIPVLKNKTSQLPWEQLL